MENVSMRRLLHGGQALNVRDEGRELESGMFELRRFVEGKDYCDPVKERWIWSIGRRFSDGKILAATDARFYGDRNFDCLFLR
jgi:hypothetical protein